MASPRGRDAIKSAFVATCVFDLEASALKIQTLADSDAAGKVHRGDQEHRGSLY